MDVMPKLRADKDRESHMNVVYVAKGPIMSRDLLEDLSRHGFEPRAVWGIEELFLTLESCLDVPTCFVLDSCFDEVDLGNPYELLLWYGMRAPFVVVSMTRLLQGSLCHRNVIQVSSIDEKDFLCFSEVLFLLERHVECRSLRQPLVKEEGIVLSESSPEGEAFVLSADIPDLSGLPKSRRKLLEYFMVHEGEKVALRTVLSQMWNPGCLEESEYCLLKSRFYAYIHDIRIYLNENKSIGNIVRAGKETYLFTRTKKTRQRSYIIGSSSRSKSVTI